MKSQTTQAKDFFELCQKGTAAQVREAIALGAEINVDNIDELTPLMLAAASNTAEVVEALIKAGAEVNAEDSLGRTPLMLAAASNGRPDVIEVLVKAGAEVNGSDLFYQTPLLAAIAESNTTEVIITLLKAGANPNQAAQGQTPLMQAIVHNNVLAVIQALVNAGADPNAQDEFCQTPLMYVIDYDCDFAIAEILIAAGADKSNLDPRYPGATDYIKLPSPGTKGVMTVVVDDIQDLSEKANSHPNQFNSINLQTTQLNSSVVRKQKGVNVLFSQEGKIQDFNMIYNEGQMNGYEFIIRKQIEWAKNRGIMLTNNNGENEGRQSYTRTLDENLFERISEKIKACFDKGAGGEIRGKNSKRPKMCALHSSSAMGVNLFQHWVDSGQVAAIAVACGFCHKDRRGDWDLRFEEKFLVDGSPDFHDHPPNLDVVIYNTNGDKTLCYAIECKYTEPYRSHKPIDHGISPTYMKAENNYIWEGLNNLRHLAAILSPEDNRFTHLHAAQLIKHILGIKWNRNKDKGYAKSNFRLLYLYYDCTRELIMSFFERGNWVTRPWFSL